MRPRLPVNPVHSRVHDQRSATRSMKPVFLACLSTVLVVASCDSTVLEEEVYSELGPSNFFRTEQDADALVNSAYALEQGWSGRNDVMMAEVSTDLFFIRGGSLERDGRPFEDFTWDASHAYFSEAWSNRYRAIYRTNLALERTPEIEFDPARKKVLLAEARFIRAEAYMDLYEKWGPVPLLTSGEVDPGAQPARATEAEMQKFISEEFRAAATDLPRVAAQYPRATKGAALALLARWELNQKRWQQAADAAREVMDLGVYALFDTPKRIDLFQVFNERNSEFIHVRPYVTGVTGNVFSQHTTPVRYRFRAPPKVNFATDWKMYSAFIDTFDPRDQRREAFLFEYVDTDGRLIRLGRDDVRSMKFQEDLNATSTNNGGDVPLIRYADVLLIRAEALNELRGPNVESIDLINQVRARAAVPALRLSDYATKEALRAHILAERGWEFHTESLRRQDLIRHGKLVEYARARGARAEPHHVRYPLPQTEIDKNPNLKQNEGY